MLLIAVCLVGFFAEPIFTRKVFSPAGMLFDYPPWNAQAPPGYTRPNSGLADRVTQHDPWRMFNRESYRRGELPLWNPYISSGLPHLANYQAAPLYPPDLALLPLPFETARLVVTMLHLGIAGLFTWLFLRRIGLAPAGAVLGALSFMFSGALVLWIGSPGGTVVIWLPALMYLTACFVEAPRPGIWLALYAVLVVQFLGGHPESSHYIVVAVWIFFAFRLTERWRIIGRRRGLRLLGAYAGASALGVLTAAVQIVPFIEYLAHTRYPSGIFHTALATFFPAPRVLAVIMLVFPYLFGHPAWGDREFTGPLGLPVFNEIAGVYIGVLPLLLACWTVATRWRRDPDVRFFTLFAAVSLAYFYRLPVVYALLKLNPLFNVSLTLLVPALSNFCLAYLAGRGLDDWAGRVDDQERRRTVLRTARWLLAGAVGVTVVVALSQVVLTQYRERIIAFGEARVEALARERARSGTSIGEWRAAGFWSRRVPVTYENMRWAARTPLITVGILAAGAGLLGIARGVRGRRAVVVGAAALTLGDLFLFGIRLNASTDPKNVYPVTDSIRVLQGDRSLFRIFGVNQVLPPNVGMVYHLTDMRGFDALWLYRYTRLIMADGTLVNSNLANPFSYPDYRSRMLDLANVKYVLADVALPEPGRLQLIFRRDIWIYQNREVLPRAWLVSRVHRAANADDALRRLLAPEFDARREAVVEEGVALPGGASAVAGSAQVLRYDARRVDVRTSSRAPALLVLSENYYPGWRATVDGEERPVHLTNVSFRGVVVPAGEHQVEFLYDPWSVKLGGWISASALAVALVGAAAWRRRGRNAR